jgi:hypothetical protein
MKRRAARIAMLLVDEARARLADRGIAGADAPAAGVIFDEVWPLAKTLPARERSLEQAADWHAALSQEAQATLDEGLAAAVSKWTPPVLRDERRLVELDPMQWRLALECLPPSAAELAGMDLAVEKGSES